MAVFFLFLTVQFGISSVLDERRDGTLARMLVASIRRSAVLGGKLLTSVALGAVSMAVLAVTTLFLLGALLGRSARRCAADRRRRGRRDRGDGARRHAGANAGPAQAWQSMVALVLGMLGGTFFPVAQAGGLLAALSLVTPQAWFLRGIENLAGGASAAAVAGPVAAMLAFAAITGSLAFLRAGKLIAR